ncbi:MAG: sugar transferase [Clostridia bacterium]|nr:sugar transferase [Clostridia bacterium]
MLVKKWEKLPQFMQIDEIRPYYEVLRKKWFSLLIKRIFDIIVSALMLIILSPVFLILAIAIKIDSRGPVFYRQTRITQYGKEFRIFKFRTMVSNADKIGTAVTVKGDSRITKVGKFIRKCRLDEISQLIDVFRGTMTFVGTRPEVKKYVDRYTPEMLATLLLPAGVTSDSAIYYKDEAELLDNSLNPDETYVREVLPGKMYYNLKAIKNFGFWREIGTMIKTVFAVLGKDYKGDYVPPQKKSKKQYKLNKSKKYTVLKRARSEK